MIIKTRTKITSVLEDVWRNREKLEEAEKKVKSKIEYERQTTDQEIKMKLNQLLLRGLVCFIVLMTVALIFGFITWTSETFNIHEVSIVVTFVTVICLCILLFS